MEVVACDIGNMCMESYPCQHSCCITYVNETSEIICLSGWDLVTDKYWKLLNDNDKSHFRYMQRCIQDEEEEDKSNYTLFLQHTFITSSSSDY